MLSNVDLVNSIRMLSLTIHTSHWLSFVPLTSNADGLVKAELRCRISPLWNEGYTAIFMVLLANKVPLSLSLTFISLGFGMFTVADASNFCRKTDLL